MRLRGLHSAELHWFVLDSELTQLAVRRQSKPQGRVLIENMAY